MPLVEIARFTDVYEADLAAAFLASHDIEVSVTERFQTTVDPLMQRALGIRLLGRFDQAAEARDLLARVRAGEFATEEGDDIPPRGVATQGAGVLMALAAFASGGFWGNSLPRRFRAPSWQGMLIVVLFLGAATAVILAAAKVVMDPP